MDLKQMDLDQVVREVLNRLSNEPSVKGAFSDIKGTAPGQDGIFARMEDAIGAAGVAQQQLSRICLAKRKVMIQAMREAVLSRVEEIGALAVRETGLGNLGDKVKKNILAAEKTPGVEDVEPKVYTGDHGLTLVEHAPFGVIGAITPSTNPSETVICNGIGMIAAGNSVVFNSHPAARQVTQLTIGILNRAIVAAGGPANLLCVVAEPTVESGTTMMKHPQIRLLVVTGGPEIVKIAMNSGKKVIAAGPGNPPVMVDETADIEEAAKYIVDGASFDNNVLCVAEKEVFVVATVADPLLAGMVRQGAYRLTLEQLNSLMEHITVQHQGGRVMNKKFIGKDVQVILQAIGLEVGPQIRLAVCEVPKDHPLVYLEQLMPVLPVVRVRDVDEGIDLAYQAERNNFHTAFMYSKNVEHLTKMSKVMNTTIFVKNAPSYAGLGMLGEGFTSFTIASPTGEGVTSAISFTRQRRCVLKDQFRII